MEQVMSVSCLVCRRRKIKCDRTPGSCKKCRALGEQCLYSTKSAAESAERVSVNVSETVHPSDSITQAGLKRRRVLRSCVECKRTKSKCSGGPACDRCSRKVIKCCFRDTHLDSRQDLVSDDNKHKTSQAIPPWLLSRTLPHISLVRELIDIYFAYVHSVRCLGFLHIPSFMEQFHKYPGEELSSAFSGLIYIICALAAPIYYSKTVSSIDQEFEASNPRFLIAGKGWAECAMQCLFANFGNPSVECLMTEILLHEHYLRIGDYWRAFLISGFISRRVQLLRLNVENDRDILCRADDDDNRNNNNNQPVASSWAASESRRRLLWACYLLDASIECGFDQLRFMSAGDVQVQLPCAEDSFIRNSPCVTEMLPAGKVMPFVDQALAMSAVDNIDMRGYYIRAMAIRSKILRYRKHLDGDIPWDASTPSQFYVLDKELQSIESSIPETLKMRPENVYIYKTAGRVNLFFGLHILISQTYTDLYRIGIATPVFSDDDGDHDGDHDDANKWIRQNASDDFMRLCHRTCIAKALHIGSLLSDLWHCHKLSIVDTPYAIHTQTCSSVLVASLVSWRDHLPGPPPLPGISSYRDCQQILQRNVQTLRYLAMHIKADVYCESAVQALRRFNRLFAHELGSGGLPNDNVSSIPQFHVAGNSEKTKSPTQYSLEFILNPLGTYPMARKEVSTLRSESPDNTDVTGY